MNRNYKLKWMFASSLARRVGWLGLIAMLGVGLLYPASAQNTNRNQKVPPRTPQQKQQVEIEKKTGVANNAERIIQPGSLKGRVFVYVSSYAHKGKLELWNCDGYIADHHDSVRLLDSNKKIVAQSGLKNGKHFCSFDIKDVPPGAYKLELDLPNPVIGDWGFVQQPLLLMKSPSHTPLIDCKDSGGPCDRNSNEIVMIGSGRVTNVDLTAKQP